MCHSPKSDHDLASESPDSLPELCQSEPQTFDQEQLVALELQLSAVSEDDADWSLCPWMTNHGGCLGDQSG